MTKIKRKFGEQTPEQLAENRAKAHARISFLSNRIKSPNSIPVGTLFGIREEISLIKGWNYDNSKIENLTVSQLGVKEEEAVEITVAEKGCRVALQTCAKNIVYINGTGWVAAEDLQSGENIKRMIGGVFTSSPVVAIKKIGVKAFYLTKSTGLANFDPSSGILLYCDCERSQKIKARYLKSQTQYDERKNK